MAKEIDWEEKLENWGTPTRPLDREEWMGKHAKEWDGDDVADAVIDPDAVSGWDVEEVVWSRSWRGWDCEEGERVVQVRHERHYGLVHHWWRRASRMSQRRRRDLWRVLWREEDPQTEEPEPEPEPEEEEDEADE